jgi:hypothetical protein
VIATVPTHLIGLARIDAVAVDGSLGVGGALASGRLQLSSAAVGSVGSAVVGAEPVVGSLTGFVALVFVPPFCAAVRAIGELKEGSMFLPHPAITIAEKAIKNLFIERPSKRAGIPKNPRPSMTIRTGVSSRELLGPCGTGDTEIDFTDGMSQVPPHGHVHDG